MPYSDPSWEEQQKHLDAAKTLAEFANLMPDGVDSFRKEHLDFFPEAWWDYRPTNPSGSIWSLRKQWQIVQQHVRDAWLCEFQLPLFNYVLLLTSVFNPDNLDVVWGQSKLTKQHHPPFVTGLDIEDEYPYHLAVEWLSGQNWRVRQCKYCDKYFIAETSRQRFCSNKGDTSCFWAHRKKYQHDDWKENAKQTNKSRRDNYDPKDRRRRYVRDRKTHKPSTSSKARKR